MSTGGTAQIVAGAEHSCATRIDGFLWCWGANENGQVGDVTLPSADTFSPVQVHPQG